MMLTECRMTTELKVTLILLQIAYLSMRPASKDSEWLKKILDST